MHSTEFSTAKPNNSVLLASGIYQYLLNDQVQDIVEPWWLYQSEAGWVLHSDRVVGAGELCIKTQSLWQKGTLKTVDIGWYADSAATPQRQVSYSCESSRRIVYSDHDDLALPAQQDVICQENSILMFPLMRIYMGAIIAGLQQQGGEGEVLVPWIKDPQQHTRLLTPSISIRRVKFLGEDRIDQDGELISAKCFSYHGEQYGEDTKFWIHKGVLQCYRWHQDSVGDWLVKLQQWKTFESKVSTADSFFSAWQ